MSAIEIVVQFKDVHGVALTTIWIIAAIQNCMTLLAAIMMLIKRSTGPLQRAHKIMHIIFLLCCAHKKNTEKRSAA